MPQKNCCLAQLVAAYHLEQRLSFCELQVSRSDEMLHIVSYDVDACTQQV